MALDTTLAPNSTLAPADQKVVQLLGDRVVLKPLTRWNEAYKEFPRYVMEYLCARYVDPANPIPGQHRIDELLREHYVDSDAKELIKSRIKEKSEYVLLGSLQVRLDASRDHYWAEVPALGDNFVRIGQRVLQDYAEILLTGGAWGTMTIEYDARYEIRGRIYPFLIREFKPFQITRLDLDDYIAKREQFTTEEWIDLLIQTIGFNPAKFSDREKMLMLLRLVPFVEANTNLIELGPRETGKTYTYRNTSSKSFVISGGKATPATLFYNIACKKIGILGYRDVVFFDEIAATSFTDPEATISVLKDYMQTGGSVAARSNSPLKPALSWAATLTPISLDALPPNDIGTYSKCCPLNYRIRLSWIASMRFCLAGNCPRSTRRIMHRVWLHHGLSGRDFHSPAPPQLPDSRKRADGLCWDHRPQSGCHPQGYGGAVEARLPSSHR